MRSKECRNVIECFNAVMSIYKIKGMRKITYGRRLLKGQAEKSIKGLALIEDNYRKVKKHFSQHSVTNRQSSITMWSY